jgi:hypothetical protein
MAFLPVAPAPYRTKQEFAHRRRGGAAIEAMARQHDGGVFGDDSKLFPRRGTVA